MANIENLDLAVGKILDYLIEQQLIENTLIIFSSDNGSYRQASNGDLRAVKSYVYEGAIADLSGKGRQERYWKTATDLQSDTVGNAVHAQGGDKRRDAKAGHQDSVDQARNQPKEQSGKAACNYADWFGIPCTSGEEKLHDFGGAYS